MSWLDFSINPKKPLYETPIFWWCTLTPLFIGMVLSLLIIPNLFFDFSPKGYQYFLSVFSLPVGVASISLVLGVMIGRFHGSKQRATSICQSELNTDLTRANQTFQQYFEHRKQFSNWVSDEKIEFTIAKQEQTLSVNAMGLYGLIFPKNSVQYMEYNVDRHELFHIVISFIEIISFDLTSKHEQDDFSGKWVFFKILSIIEIHPFNKSPEYWLPYYEKETLIDLINQLIQVIYKATDFLDLSGIDSDEVSLYEVSEILIKDLESSDVFYEKLKELQKIEVNKIKSSNTMP
jgi:hypothetical protein